ncbi:MAG TPA: hypothetical protein VFI11_08290, partial [Anaerolineales bacterium]|nr:hypothetical protein [Anaerolineales bacterium]
LPSWPSDFLAQLKDYTSYTELGSVSWIITTYYLRLPRGVEWVVTGSFVVWAAWEWYRSRRFGFRAMLWTTGLSLVLTHFIAPRTATTHFAPLMLPMFLWFSLRSQTGAGGRNRVPAIVMTIVFVGTWWLFLATVQGRQESAITYLPIPLVLAALLPLIRKPWLRLSQEAV